MNRFTPIANASGGAGNVPGERRYWAFLSYAHTDAKAAARLHAQLERFRVPVGLVGKAHPLGTIPARLTPVFRDRQELAASSDLRREIAEALEKSNYFIVLCSPAAARSKWVDQEIREYRRLHGADRILAAILDGEPVCDDDRRECFPPALREEGVEPIAADLRASGDGWRGGFLKLVAGMLDVGLDEIVQRDQQRRQKRMAWMAAASLVGMVFTTGMSVMAIDARDTARDERREAESLVAFMLGELREELEPIGELDSLDKVGVRALAYYERQDKTGLTDEQLAQRSRALTLLGEIASSRVDLQGALARYREAMRGTGELVARFPNDPQRLFDHAQNVFYVGDIARKQGDLAGAERAFKEYHSLANRMIAVAPGNPTYRLERKYAETNLGVVLLERHRYAEAARQFDGSLRTLDGLIEADPANPDYWKSKIESYAWLSDSKLGQWRMEEALVDRQRGLLLVEQATARFPRDANMLKKSAPLLRSIARLQASRGDVSAGIRSAREGLATSERLLAIEPGNMNWRETQAFLRLELANMLLDQGQTEQAGAEVAKACAARGPAREDATAVEWRRIAIRCFQGRARVALAMGSQGQALVLAGEGLSAAKRYRSGDPVNDRVEVAEAQKLIGDIMRSMGETEGSRQAYEAGLRIWPANHAPLPRAAAIRAALLRGAGQTEAAQALEARLQRIGYRKLF
ncbi:MAG TPA: TIR domain-containing protein [Sphingomicrobium sp.]|nr:TIR domain-containing protein [Sphingomicrobium sp.]